MCRGRSLWWAPQLLAHQPVSKSGDTQWQQGPVPSLGLCFVDFIYSRSYESRLLCNLQWEMQVLPIRAVGTNQRETLVLHSEEHLISLQWESILPTMRAQFEGHERTNFWVQRWCERELIMCYPMLEFLVRNTRHFVMWRKESSSCNDKFLCPCENSSWNDECCPLMDSTNWLQQYVTYWAKLLPCLCAAVWVNHDLF